MLKLNKKTEYALLSLKHLSSRVFTAPVSVREVASRYGIPEMLLAKVLQKLKRGQLVTSTKGANGGYRLLRPLKDIRVIEVFELFDEQMALVECVDDHDACQAISCDIKSPMVALNSAIQRMLAGMTMEDLFDSNEIGPVPELSIYRA